MESLLEKSDLVHGPHGRCMFVANRQCGPGCQGFDESEQRCAVIANLATMATMTTIVVATAGKEGIRAARRSLERKSGKG